MECAWYCDLQLYICLSIRRILSRVLGWTWTRIESPLRTFTMDLNLLFSLSDLWAQSFMMLLWKNEFWALNNSSDNKPLLSNFLDGGAAYSDINTKPFYFHLTSSVIQNFLHVLKHDCHLWWKNQSFPTSSLPSLQFSKILFKCLTPVLKYRSGGVFFFSLWREIKSRKNLKRESKAVQRLGHKICVLSLVTFSRKPASSNLA